MAYAPQVTVSVDFDPVPRVEVNFTALDPATRRVTIFRNSDGRIWRVRGAIDLNAVGTVSRPDYEPPFNVTVSYYAMQYDQFGNELGYTSSTTVTVPMDPTVVVFHNPLNPREFVKTAYRSTAAQELSRPIQGEVVQPEGRTVGVLVARGRQGLTNVNLDIVTETHADADMFQTMFGSYSERRLPVVCVRSAGPTRIPKTLFAAILNPIEQDATVHLGGAMVNWELEGSEVAPPAEGLITPLLTYADFNAFYAGKTYATFNADYPSYQAANRDYSKRGFAGAN